VKDMSLLKQEKITITDSKMIRFRLFLSIGIFIIWSSTIFIILKDISYFLDWFENLGSLAPILFTLMLILGVIILAPTPIIKVTAGALFPYWIAVIINFTASIVGGLLAFLLGRWLFRDVIAKTVARDKRLQNLETAIGEESMRISVLVRLSPLIPDEWLNYLMASGPVTTRVFFISNLSSIVYSFAYAYFGHAVGKIALSSDGMGGFRDSPIGMFLMMIGLIATILATFIVTKVTMKTLKESIED